MVFTGWPWPQIMVSGFALGSFYALVALGFSLIFGITRAFNLAHGEMIVLGGYLAFFLWKFLQVPFLLTLPASLSVMGLLSLLLFLLLRRLQEPYALNTLVVTFGLALLLQSLMLALFSADYHMIRAGLPSFTIPRLGFTVSWNQGLLLLLSLLATGGVHVLLKHTFLGKALRATIQDPEAAQIAGINVRIMSFTAFGMGGMLIGLAGPLYAQNMYLYPTAGPEATMIAIIITIFAGVGRIRTLLIGGWILGLMESTAILTVGGKWRELVSAVVLVTLLYFRPEGISFRKPG